MWNMIWFYFIFSHISISFVFRSNMQWSEVKSSYTIYQLVLSWKHQGIFWLIEVFQNHSGVSKSWSSKSFSSNNVISYLDATRKDAFVNHSKWLHFLPVRENDVAPWSRISNCLRLTKLSQCLFKMFNNWYSIGIGEEWQSHGIRSDDVGGDVCHHLWKSWIHKDKRSQ